MEKSGIVTSLIKVNPLIQIAVGVNGIKYVGVGVSIGMSVTKEGVSVWLIMVGGGGVPFPPQADKSKLTMTPTFAKTPGLKKDTEPVFKDLLCPFRPPINSRRSGFFRCLTTGFLASSGNQRNCDFTAIGLLANYLFYFTCHFRILSEKLLGVFPALP